MKLIRVIQAILVIALALNAWLGATPQADAQATPPEAVAALLIIDVSGSNRTTDPGNLRFTDARLFASLLDDGDALGVMTFSTQSRRLTNGLVVIGSPTDKRALIRALQAVAPDGYTDFKAAFIEARAMLGSANLHGRKPVVICLTDGQPEIAAPYASYGDEALAEAKKLDVPVMSIALTDAALTPFLSRLARETGGAVIPASQAEDLLDAYLAVFSQIKDRTVVGSGATAAPGSVDLALDPALMPYLESASFVLSNTAGVQAAFLGPDGLPVREGAGGVAFLMQDDPLFTVVTVDQPAGGKWAFRLGGSGEVQGRAIIRSRLRVDVATPGSLHEAGQPMPVTVRLVEEKTDGRIIKIIGEASFSALITRPDGKQESLDRFYDDGTHGDVQAGDGDYTRLYVNAGQPGAYSITVRGNKGQVPVERTVRVQAVTFPALQPDALDGTHFDVRGQPVTIAARLAGSAEAQFDGGELHATVRPPTGQPSELVLKWDGQRYAANYLPQEDGSYQVEFAPDGATYQGLSYGHTAQASFTARIVPAITIGVRTIEDGGGASTADQFANMWRDSRKYGIWLHLVTQSPSLIPPGILASCNNLFAAQLKNGKDRDTVIAALARSEKGFVDEPWRRCTTSAFMGELRLTIGTASTKMTTTGPQVAAIRTGQFGVLTRARGTANRIVDGIILPVCSGRGLSAPQTACQV